jgi:beta-glucosidase
VTAANPRTIVVIVGTVVEMDGWLDRVPAVLQAWYPGMEGGTAIAEALFGDINPSGKLPVTFPHRLEDSPAHALHAFPGERGTVRYAEGRLVGYRWFDTKAVEPLFPFGHGLSYSRFEYSDLNIKTDGTPQQPHAVVSCVIRNVGQRAGAEVAQLYLTNPTDGTSYQELKGFAKAPLQPGEERTVSFELPAAAFEHYDVAQHGWAAAPGKYEARVGGSSRDIRLRGSIELAGGKS